jgi:hypothetical protein
MAVAYMHAGDGMSGTVFATALYIGSASIALWISVRYPRLAPSSLMVRAVAPMAAGLALQLVRIDTSSSLKELASLFLVAFPVLIGAWLTAVWLLQMLRELPGSGAR